LIAEASAEQEKIRQEHQAKIEKLQNPGPNATKEERKKLIFFPSFTCFF